MRWKAYKDGEIREITKFCWFPTKIDDEWFWLERVKLTQVC